jgi:DNA-binding LacI/PurR family transcriptional regulator
MAETAAANLIRMIEDSEYEIPDINELPVSLVLRETTREK